VPLACKNKAGDAGGAANLARRAHECAPFNACTKVLYGFVLQRKRDPDPAPALPEFKRLSKEMPKTPGSKPARDTSSDIDAGLVREIALLLSETDLSEIEVERGDLRIRVARQTFAAPAPATAATYIAAPAAVPAAAAAAPAAPEHDQADVLKSPMVGTVYLRPSPESKPFVEVGAHVTAGQKVLLVEAMKTFNDIVAHKSGTVTALLVDDANPVEYDQPLMVIA